MTQPSQGGDPHEKTEQSPAARLRVVTPRTRDALPADGHPERRAKPVAPPQSPATRAEPVSSPLAPSPTDRWLTVLCERLEGVAAGAVVATAAAAQQTTVAQWPAASPPSKDMLTAAQRAISRNCCVIAGTDTGPTQSAVLVDSIALPLVAAGHADAAVVVSVPHAGDERRREIARQINGSLSWLRELLQAGPAVVEASQRPLLDIVVAALEHRTLRAAAMAAATSLATQLGCERVSIGFQAGKRIRLEAISRSASFDQRMALSRTIGAAMEEAMDQDSSIAFPPCATDPFRVVSAHRELAASLGAAGLCTIPFADAGSIVGAISFEHADAGRFDPATLAYCAAVTALIGPLLESKRREERGLVMQASDTARQMARDLVGRRFISVKLIAALLLLLAVVAVFGSATWRVTANAVLKGTVQRAIVAPVDGYVAAASVRAGDIVTEHQTLAVLDDRALQLEQVKWISERDRLLKEYREAMAALDASKVTVLRAQLDQANAELQLTEENLAHTLITAPIAGIVVAGDLSQAVGAPVKQGDLLFEVTPLDGYRVMLRVDEREIADVQPGQRGQLAVAGLPGDYLAFVVERVTPVASVFEGHNYFAVEARLEKTPRILRPGMQGIAKVEIGPRQLWWIWTHRITDWIRVKMWIWASWG